MKKNENIYSHIKDQKILNLAIIIRSNRKIYRNEVTYIILKVYIVV